jgi:malate dehydrogenase
MQCATNTGFNTKVSGVTNDYSKTADSNVVVLHQEFQENQE